MSHPIRSLSAGALAVAAALASAAPASAASVTPHVFKGGITLVDLAGENLDPWGFYDGTKGMAVPAIASGSEIATPETPPGSVPGGWIAAAGWGVPEGDGGSPGAVPLLAPVPVAAGFPEPRASSPCFWGDKRFGSAESRNRCGHPVPASANPHPGFPPVPMPTIFVPGAPGSDDPETPVPVPLPATGWLLGGALLAFGLRKRR